MRNCYYCNKKALEGLDPAQVKGIGLSTQGASSVLVDENNKPLLPVITWMDTRSQDIVDEISEKIPEDFFYKKTGWRFSPILDAAKGLWLKRNRPTEFGKAKKYVSTLEFVNHYLVGEWVIDPTNAAMRQMMDINTSKWDEEILELMEIPYDLLPEIRESGAFIGTLTEQASKDLGLPKETPVFNGVHDQYASSLGSATINAGQVMVGTGTAWVVMGISQKPLFTKSYISPCSHPVAGLWGGLASLQTCGATLDWIVKQTKLSYEELNKEAPLRLGKPNDIIFYPYMTGEGHPGGNSALRGSYHNLNLSHDGIDLAMAVMEGVAFQLALALEDYTANGMNVDNISIMGGALNSPVWLDILNSVIPGRVTLVENKDASGLGATVVAAVGSHEFSDYNQACDSMVRQKTMPTPNPDLVSYYSKKLKMYKELKTK